MTRDIEREILAQFTQEIARKVPGNATYYSIPLLKLALRHHKACENACNYGGEKWDKAIDRVESRIKALFDFPIALYFQHDPRGWTVKIGNMIREGDLVS